jgi:hypothetical protein
MEGFGGPALPSRIIAQCINGGYGGLRVAGAAISGTSIALNAIRQNHTPQSKSSKRHLVAGWNQFAGRWFDIRWEQTTFEDYHG